MNVESLETWQIVTALGLGLCLAEAIVPGFVILPIGLGLLLTSGAIFYLGLTPITVALGVIAPVALLWVFRKYMGSDSGRLNKVKTNTEGMVGKEAVVIQAIPPHGTGYVKLYGDEWAAKSHRQSTIEVGSRVKIESMESNKVLVRFIADPHGESSSSEENK